MAGYLGQKPAVNGIYTVDELTSSGGNTYTLSRAPGSKNNIQVSAGGLVQYPSAYSVSGTTLTLSGVPSGQKVIIRHMGETILYPNLDDNIVTSAKINANAVTATKIAANAVTAAKLETPVAGHVGVSPRNFIIDGDFTQWPEGTSARTLGTNNYGPALMEMVKDGDGTVTCERSTVVPTVAQSSHVSKYSVLLKCTGTDASIASGAYKTLTYNMTGTDYNFLHGQEISISFWVKTAAANSGDTYTFSINKSTASNYHGYAHEFTATSSWTKITHTVTIPTSESGWADDETGYVYFGFGLGSTGSTYTAANDTWTSGTWAISTSGTNNFFDSTSNELYISQFGVYLGSTAPTFVGESVATVREQVDYYVQRYEYANEGNEMICSGFQNSTTVSHCQLNYRNYLRTAAPTITHAPAAGFAVSVSGGISPATSFTDNNKGRHGCRFSVTHGSQGAAKDPCSWARDGSDTCWILIDSRH